jgi:hypothetical protein
MNLWLKKEDGLCMQSPQDQGVYDMYVNQLMLPNGKVWDCDKIKMIFPLNVANTILTVSLFDDVVEDKLIWQDDIHGNYSVKSVYFWLKSNSHELEKHQCLLFNSTED